MYGDLLYVVKGNASCGKCWLRGPLGKSWLGASADWAKHDCATKSCDCFSFAFESPTAMPTLQRLVSWELLRVSNSATVLGTLRCQLREVLDSGEAGMGGE